MHINPVNFRNTGAKKSQKLDFWGVYPTRNLQIWAEWGQLVFLSVHECTQILWQITLVNQHADDTQVCGSCRQLLPPNQQLHRVTGSSLAAAQRWEDKSLYQVSTQHLITDNTVALCWQGMQPGQPHHPNCLLVSPDYDCRTCEADQCVVHNGNWLNVYIRIQQALSWPINLWSNMQLMQ